MNSKKLNKVTISLGDKPMILHALDLLHALGISDVVVVVGFAKESVIDVVKKKALYAHQNKRLGTAHALMVGLKKVPKNISHVLVLQGDDAAFYTEKLIKNLIQTHFSKKADMTLLTIEKENPTGLGRVVRDKNDTIKEIVEEKDTSERQRQITEVNPACYLFTVDFLKSYLPKVKKSAVTGEYYLTSVIDLAIKEGKHIESVKAGKISWRGINTQEELREAQELYLKDKKYG